MARPKNIVAVVGTTVYSLSPKELKAALTSVVGGAVPSPFPGKVLGTVAVYFDGMTPVSAAATLGVLFPAPVVAPRAVAAPAPEDLSDATEITFRAAVAS